MKTHSINALLLCVALAGSLCTPHAAAQKVYRCGSVYSQTPCKGAITVDVNDSRTPEQKQEADQAIERDAETARSMEAERIKKEKQIAAEEAAARKVTEKRKLDAQREAQTRHPPHHLKPPKKSRKQPEFFTAAGKKDPDKPSGKP